jgi:hypothetical protein
MPTRSCRGATSRSSRDVDALLDRVEDGAQVQARKSTRSSSCTRTSPFSTTRTSSYAAPFSVTCSAVPAGPA